MSSPAPTFVNSKEALRKETTFGAHNYHPLPVVFEKAEGVFAWDVDGNRYYDCLSAYSATNQGHSHPKIVDALVKQAKSCALTSRAFCNSQFPKYAEKITKMFGYDAVLPMNTGAEAVETAIKMARKWGYESKGIAKDKAIVVSCKECFHGRTIAVISMSTDPTAYEGYGPMVEGLHGHNVNYNDLPALKAKFEADGERIAAFLVEPIQGEAGIIVPDEGYLKGVRALCDEHNIIFICDEIQTGLCRTGRMLAIDHEEVRPDVIILGKALSGGLYPVSAVLADYKHMNVFTAGTHGSTYGGNPLGAAVAMAALDVLVDENLAERAAALGERFRAGILALKHPAVKLVRGRGLLNAVEIDSTHLDEEAGKKRAIDFCYVLASKGVLAKPTHEHFIRFAPPLVITEEQVDEIIAKVGEALNEIKSIKMEDIPAYQLDKYMEKAAEAAH